MFKVSVIMPVYNAEDLLERSINSILEQTLKNVEVICVNDESTDNSLEVLEDFTDKYDFIKIINQKNSGSGKARNTGLDNAQGEYIAFLDADDIFVDKDSLEKMYQIGKDNDADIVGANLIRVNNDDVFEENFNYSSGNYAFFDDESVIDSKDYGIPWAFYKNIFKRSFLDENKIRFPDLLRGQDPVFLAEILTKTEKIYTVNRNLYGYYYNANGLANDKINSTEKKIDYLKHYKQTFDVLDSSNYSQISDAYKNTFISILKIKERDHDDEYVELVFEVFDDLEKYFKRDSYPYSYLTLLKPSSNIEENPEIDELLNLKEEFIDKTMTNDEFIDLEDIKEYNENIQKYENDDNFMKQSYSHVYNIHHHEQSQYNEIKNDIEQLPKEIEELKNSNEEILSSNSWKYTKFLRDIKHYLD